MRRSKEEVAETRNHIVETAASELRRHGINGIGVSDLMATAGLTHGGFYRHFESKDQLVTEASAFSMDTVVAAAEEAADGVSGEQALEAIVESYLSKAHVQDVSDGCPLVALGSELARCDEETRDAVTKGYLSLINVVASHYSGSTPQASKGKAIAAISAMVGAVTMARLVRDPKLSAAILMHTKKQILSP